MEQLEKNVRAIEKDGLVWGGSKFVPIGFGIKKLQITIVVEDEKVSLDELQEQIQEDEDHVQSSDIVSYSNIVINSVGANNYHSKPCRSCRCVYQVDGYSEHDITIDLCSEALKIHTNFMVKNLNCDTGNISG